MVKTLCVIAHRAPHDDKPLVAPVVVATLTADKRFLGHLTPYKQLEVLAGKMGLVDFEIVSSDSAALPGFQMSLPFDS